MNQITISEATEADLPALAAIELAAFSSSPLHQRVFRNVHARDYLAHSLAHLSTCVGEQRGARRLTKATRGEELLGMALWSASGIPAVAPPPPGPAPSSKYPIGTDEVLAAQIFGTPVEGKTSEHWCEAYLDCAVCRAVGKSDAAMGTSHCRSFETYDRSSVPAHRLWDGATRVGLRASRRRGPEYVPQGDHG